MTARLLRAITACVTVAGAALVLTAGPAAAAVNTIIDIPSGEVHFTAGDDQANFITVTKLVGPAHVYRFDDVHPIVFNDIYPVSAGACTYPYPADLTIMDCDHLATIISVRTGNLNDTIRYQTSLSWQLEGGDGNDIIYTGTGPGSPGRYTTGGNGDDRIYSGPGTEYISGGNGIDTVSYAGRWTVITASVGTSGGQIGETDTYSGIENLTGGGASDVLTGNSGANTLAGGYAITDCDSTTPGITPFAPPPCTAYSGNDTLTGGGGADKLIGGSGNDTLHGDAGFDDLNGGSGNDWCYVDADGGTRTNCEWPLIFPL